ncbi:cell division protein FtsI [Acidothermaceae bacterium B102]|nr:cell division protein FtsI [Acidothermaceae bacterium B102]
MTPPPDRRGSQRPAAARTRTAPRPKVESPTTGRRTADRPQPRPQRRPEELRQRPAPQRPRSAPPRPVRQQRAVRTPRGPRQRLALARPARRIRGALIFVAVLLLLLGGRLVQLQTFDSKAYAAQAVKQREVDKVLPAMRGTLYDRNGQPLAMSVDARLISANPAEVAKGVALAKGTMTVATIASTLAPMIGLTVADLTARLTQTTMTKTKGVQLKSYVVLAHGITPAVAADIATLKLPGIAASQEQKRLYPGGDLAANLVGFAGTAVNGLSGRTGLEYAYNKALAGTNGKEKVQVSVGGTVIPAAAGQDTVPAVEGSNVTLTIDRDIQWEAQQALSAAVAKTGAQNGYVVVMNPKTGEILAMASEPTFNPTSIKPTDKANLSNRALTDVYEPGSVNKVITLSGAIQDGLVTPNTAVDVPTTYVAGGHRFHDAEHHGLEHLTVTGVLAKSSNIGTIEIGQRLGQQRLYDYMSKYGFGQPTGLGLPGENPGVLPPVDHWSNTSLPTIAFGQGISVNAVQVASVYSTIANGGVRVTPRLVESTTSASGAVVPNLAKPGVRVISATVAHEVSDMLESVTTDQGTAPAARIDGYRVAGKTGTAQRADGHGGYSGYTSTFVGYAPADKPQLVVEVVLQNPINGHFGGSVAAPVFHDVMAFALAAEGIPPTGTTPPVSKLTAG